MNKPKALYIGLSAGGVFAAAATMAGLLLEKKITEYATMAAVSYVLSTVGFLFLVGWTFFRGDLDDVEAPKQKVLDAEADEK